MLDWIRFALTAVLVVVGLFLIVTGVIAQFRFKYVLNRMHAASMGDSLGLFLMVSFPLVRSTPESALLWPRREQTRQE